MNWGKLSYPNCYNATNPQHPRILGCGRGGGRRDTFRSKLIQGIYQIDKYYLRAWCFISIDMLFDSTCSVISRDNQPSLLYLISKFECVAELCCTGKKLCRFNIATYFKVTSS